MGSFEWLVGLAIYFVPAILALVRRVPNAPAIVLVNLFFGWTVIGWIAALIWAISNKRADPDADYRRYLAAAPPVQQPPYGQPYPQQPYPQQPYPASQPYLPSQPYQPQPYAQPQPSAQPQPYAQPQPQVPPVAPPAAANPDPAASLQRLGEMRDAGLISEAEYQAKRGEILLRM